MMLKSWAVTLVVTMVVSIIVVWWRKSVVWALSLTLMYPLALHFYLKNPDFVGYSVDYIDLSRTDNSNNPTIQHGDFIISKHFNVVMQRGAMYAVFVDNKLYRKRLHGIPQDNIHVCNLRVYVNGNNYSTDQQWIGKGISDFSQCQNTNHAFKLKDGEYYLLGDHIYNSNDSRNFGPVEKSQVIAKALYLINSKGIVTELEVRFKKHPVP
ncbi:signal peptidase I [Rheinheimera riviphila]|nr:signal peptidase I [Rheinheimera riviphila]